MVADGRGDRALVDREHDAGSADCPIELGYAGNERVLEAGVGVIGIVFKERDHLAVALGSLPVLAALLVHHAERSHPSGTSG